MAVRYLARRDFSRAELAQRLAQRGIEVEVIERTLDELMASGYLSDERYAAAVVAQRTGRYGKRAIAYALKEKGIDATAAEAAMAPLALVDEFDHAQALWQQRFGKPPASDRDKARQVRFLQARGFGLSVVLRVLRAAGQNVDDET
ncbi:MAG: regulatory protein RecX [Betaproteobacteria bacterium]